VSQFSNGNSNSDSTHRENLDSVGSSGLQQLFQNEIIHNPVAAARKCLRLLFFIQCPMVDTKPPIEDAALLFLPGNELEPSGIAARVAF
jgi:hypothetical protein